MLFRIHLATTNRQKQCLCSCYEKTTLTIFYNDINSCNQFILKLKWVALLFVVAKGKKKLGKDLLGLSLMSPLFAGGRMGE